MVCRTAVHRESDGITTGAYRARGCSRPYLRGAGVKFPGLLATYFPTRRPCAFADANTML
jgi:hypothetical protein